MSGLPGPPQAAPGQSSTTPLLRSTTNGGVGEGCAIQARPPAIGVTPPARNATPIDPSWSRTAAYATPICTTMFGANPETLSKMAVMYWPDACEVTASPTHQPIG